MSCVNFIIKRSISTTAICNGKRNFKKFSLSTKRGTRIFKQQQMENPDPDIPVDKRGVRDTGYTSNGKFVLVQEMVPELIVPDLKDCKLKPYVSYRTPDVIQSEFTAQDLFDAIYSKKITEDFQKNKLNADGSPEEPSTEEKLTPQEAYLNARKTGADIM